MPKCVEFNRLIDDMSTLTLSNCYQFVHKIVRLMKNVDGIIETNACSLKPIVFMIE